MQTRNPIIIRQLSYALPNGQVLFNHLNLTLAHHRVGLVGRNGIGKSTLIKLIAGEISLQAGIIQSADKIAYLPQNPSISSHTTIAAIFHIDDKITALQHIREGSLNEWDYNVLNDDWDIEERYLQQLAAFGLNHLTLDRTLDTLSGGELTRLLLIKAFLSDAEFLLLDEPTNHLDTSAKKRLQQLIQQDKRGILIISHDRDLLNHMDEIIELTTLGAKSYGGNYEAYILQKDLEHTAALQQLQDAKKALTQRLSSIQQASEKHAQRAAYGKNLRKTGSIDKLSANAAKGRSERSQRKMLIKEEQMLENAQQQLITAKAKVEIINKIVVELPATLVANGKILLDVENVSFQYPNTALPIINHFSFTLKGPERVAITGDNGSGKTTLIKLILGELIPTHGTIDHHHTRIAYLDQNSQILKPELSILDNFKRLNPQHSDNVAYMNLARFLFKNEHVHKLVDDLSGGEKLRAALACVLMTSQPPQLLILDEPTNHLDIESIQQIESALQCFEGAMIIISHDHRFLHHCNCTRVIDVPQRNYHD